MFVEHIVVRIMRRSLVSYVITYVQFALSKKKIENTLNDSECYAIKIYTYVYITNTSASHSCFAAAVLRSTHTHTHRGRIQAQRKRIGGENLLKN